MYTLSIADHREVVTPAEELSWSTIGYAIGQIAGWSAYAAVVSKLVSLFAP